ncbi:MAG: zinc-binding dehydrogenase [Vulcanimicrobiaceae bacterium]
MTGLELRSTITSSGELTLNLEEVPVPEPGPDQVVLRVEAAPINPSDLGLLFGPADPSTFRAGGTPQRPTITASVPRERLPLVAGRLDQSMPVGNEGAGIVVKAGANAQALLGRTVATRSPGMYAQYRLTSLADSIVLPEGTPPRDGASAFVNPFTVLAMLETMRHEGHTAIVHTAAASNLGQMLVRACLADGVPLVNIVRSADQAALLRGIGAEHVVDSTSPTFVEELTAAISATGATLAFDAIGGGTLASTILHCMEVVAVRAMTTYSRYGSNTHKQVYLYGSLDFGPTILNRSYGMAWGIGGWLVFSYLATHGAALQQRLAARIAAELTTTFASTYTAEIGLAQALDPATIAAYSKRATGAKYLINPAR